MAEHSEWGDKGGGGGGKKSGLEGAIQQKVLGVPAWALALIMSAGFIAFIVWRNRRKANSAAAPGSATGTPADAGTFDPNAVDPATGLLYSQEMPADYGLPAGAIGGYLSQDPTNPAYPVGLTEQGLPGPVTNLQWARLAADSLIAKGSDPTLVQTALSKFLAGQPLSQAEQSVENLALTMFGSPPEGVTPVSSNPSTTSFASQDAWRTAVLQFANANPVALQKGSNSNGQVVTDPNAPAIGAPLTITNVQQAIDNWLSGKPLSLWESNTVAWATTAVGGPPPSAPGYAGRVYEAPGSYGPGTPAQGTVVPGQNWYGTLNGITYVNPNGQ